MITSKPDWEDPAYVLNEATRLMSPNPYNATSQRPLDLGAHVSLDLPRPFAAGRGVVFLAFGKNEVVIGERPYFCFSLL